MKATYFTRKGKTIAATPTADNSPATENLMGYVGIYKSINDAKRASRKIQNTLDLGLGLGSVAVI